MPAKLRYCGKDCIFWCSPSENLHYASHKTRCQIHAAVHPTIRKDNNTQFKSDEPCYFGILSSFNYSTKGITHDELVEIANRTPKLFKRKVTTGDVRAFDLAAYVSEASSQRSAK